MYITTGQESGSIVCSSSFGELVYLLPSTIMHACF